MKTPIVDFVRSYADTSPVRLHMPGHKGAGDIERYDITEIPGADSLYEASGIIMESERLAGELFGCHTFYSCEGSSLCIRAMLYLILSYAKDMGRGARVLAARNAHKTFIGAAALLGIEVDWMVGSGSYLSSAITAEDVAEYLDKCSTPPAAVYVTCPDYLGGMADVCAIAEVCHARGVLLAVDNAHGAYLRFLTPSRHPMDLGADICCDSAHKTLPVLTGGAYLHVSDAAPTQLYERARTALSIFGSTSPSYLILQSLDRANAYLSCGYEARLADFAERVFDIEADLCAMGYELYGDEPLKITVCPKSYGYTGYELAEILAVAGVIAEFADRDHTVLMLTPEIAEDDLIRARDVLLGVERRTPVSEYPPSLAIPKRAMSPREAMLMPSEWLPRDKCLGKTLAAVTVGCPPAVPIIVMGEVVDECAMRAFEYYGITELCVLKDT